MASLGKSGSEGMLTSSNGVQYTYDALQQRVAKFGSSFPGETIYFNGRPIALLSTSGGGWTDLIWAGQSLIGEVAGNEAAVPVYRLLDHEGTLAMTTDGSGNVLGSNDYAPYGQILTSTTNDPYVFTGLHYDTEYGGDDAWYRNYSAEQSRWLQPDPYNGSYDPMNPQSFNRYGYVNGNPLNATDPTGLAGAGIATGIGGSFCSSIKNFNGLPVGSGLYINPCDPVPSAIALAIFGSVQVVPYLSFATTFACGFASSSDTKSTFCGQSGWTQLISKNHPDLATGINDAIATVALIDAVDLQILHTSLAMCLEGMEAGAADGACYVAIGILAYTVANDLISAILDFLGDGGSKFTGSMMPRPADMPGIGTSPIGIPNHNLTIPSLIGRSMHKAVSSPGMGVR